MFFVVTVVAVMQITVRGGNASYDVMEKNFKIVTGKEMAKRTFLQ